nr:uncharacterized protein DDB_G0284459-like [Penaeus vannamei]
MGTERAGEYAEIGRNEVARCKSYISYTEEIQRTVWTICASGEARKVASPKFKGARIAENTRAFDTPFQNHTCVSARNIQKIISYTWPKRGQEKNKHNLTALLHRHDGHSGSYCHGCPKRSRDNTYDHHEDNSWVTEPNIVTEVIEPNGIWEFERAEKGKRRQHCTYCKNHGRTERKTNHKCQFETCECLLCKLTRLSRLIMRHQQRLWRHLKDTKRRRTRLKEEEEVEVEEERDGGGGGGWGRRRRRSTGGTGRSHKCDMCRNHGDLKSKRAHKNTCPYQHCTCALCSLTRKRRDIMRHQQRVRRSQVTTQQRDEAYDYVTQATAELAQLSMNNQVSSSSSSPVTSSCTVSSPAITTTPSASSSSSSSSTSSSTSFSDAPSYTIAPSLKPSSSYPTSSYASPSTPSPTPSPALARPRPSCLNPAAGTSL